MTKKEMFKAIEVFKKACADFYDEGIQTLIKREQEAAARGELDFDEKFDEHLASFVAERDEQLGAVSQMQRELNELYVAVMRCNLVD